jgi:hypothetical protein
VATLTTSFKTQGSSIPIRSSVGVDVDVDVVNAFKKPQLARYSLPPGDTNTLITLGLSATAIKLALIP